ncbi:hypothetical protein NDR87_17370 [Nocardia sp. CDC159]|uniref:Aspartate/glutamate/uridylate kinase domain-containing protein n=1 Tax=Nocardia pulmonis TaxID=2951408 RepID=A0A9X2EAN9_9NOCA|nr:MULTISPECIES: hypothetical protein [Nocardia]MCM6775893.1 hypothetical protein [Nocardia pulmonis]MCM6788131.1 hypothetical protein [Nocardia sp. CDC159]
MSRVNTVIKLGGSCVDELDDRWWDDLAENARRTAVLLVHGWSRPLRSLDPAHGEPGAFLRDRYGNRSRYTTPAVIRDIRAVSGQIRAGIARNLSARGIGVDQIVGSDGLLNTAAGERLWWRDGQLVEIDNLVGPIREVNVERLAHRAADCVIVTPLASDPAGRTVNTDADRAAAALAGATGATDLVLVTDVSHFLVDGKPMTTLTPRLAARHRDGTATGGMRKKLRAATEAIDHGVATVVLGSGTITDLLSGRSGTRITDHRTQGTSV